MTLQSKTRNIPSNKYIPKLVAPSQIVTAFKQPREFKSLLEQYGLSHLDELFTLLTAPPGKKSFLVFKNNKYINVLTENIAFFYVKYESSIIVGFDTLEYCLNQSLEHIQNLLPGKQFFRLNRQYLLNFDAVKEVEHYFARKLLVNLVIPTKDKLIVSKEKVRHFLHWLDDR